MVGSTETSPPPPDQDRPGAALSFQGVVTFGNILILVGMLGTGVAGIFSVGSQVQSVRDAITREGDMRIADVRDLKQQITALSDQQAKDMAQVSSSLGDLRADVRSLLLERGRWKGTPP